LSRGRSPSLPRSLQHKRIVKGKASGDGRQSVKTSRTSEHIKGSAEKSEKDMHTKHHNDVTEQRYATSYDVLPLRPKQLASERAVHNTENIEVIDCRRLRRDQSITSNSDDDVSESNSEGFECVNQRISEENVPPRKDHCLKTSKYRCDDVLSTKAHVKPNRRSYRRSDDSISRSPSRKRSSCYLNRRNLTEQVVSKRFWFSFKTVLSSIIRPTEKNSITYVGRSLVMQHRCFVVQKT